VSDEAKGGRRFGTATYALITAAIALVGGVTGLVFDLSPGLRPDPRNTRSADVKVIAVETGVRQGDWLDRATPSKQEADRKLRALVRAKAGDPDDPADVAAVRRERGTLIYVQTTVEGFKRDDVRLRWSVYDARTKRRVRDRELHDQEAVEVRLAAPTDRSVTQTWAPDPLVEEDGRGPFFTRFELRDEDGIVLAVTDSEPFTPGG
jgi:hypothetical protein